MAPSSCTQVEVAVVGGGVAGTALAAVLARRGLQVALIDPRSGAAPDFRAEKLTGGQVAVLRRLGLAAPVLAAATPITRLRIARFGQLVEERGNEEWGFDYAALVDALRAAVPVDAMRITRATRIAADADGAAITLADGTTISARVAVVATGLGKALLSDLGIEHVDSIRDGSLAIGFDLVPAPGASQVVPLTYFGERPTDLAAYLTLFPIEERLRANLFTYHRRDDPWVASLRGAPLDALDALMPGLARLLPPLAGTTTPVIRPIYLYASTGHLRPGAVLIGDAFANTCPTGGSGLAKALNDVERLAAHLPGWLATPGLSRGKIAAFYADPAKRAGDAAARATVRHARALALERGPYWTLRRHAGFHVQRLRSRLRTASDDGMGPGILPKAISGR